MVNTLYWETCVYTYCVFQPKQSEYLANGCYVIVARVSAGSNNTCFYFTYQIARNREAVFKLACKFTATLEYSQEYSHFILNK